MNKKRKSSPRQDNGMAHAETAEFTERVHGGETLEDLLPEAFAVVREASLRR